MTEKIPQVIAIVSISPDGKLDLKKDVREHLGMKDAKTLFLDMQDEMILSAKEDTSEEIAVMKGNRIHLPEEALRKLRIAERSLVGFVQRRDAVAIKKFIIKEKEGERASIVDVETTYKIIRIAETNPMPERLLQRLREQYKEFRLKYDVGGFLKGRRTFETWKARKILGIAGPSDEALRGQLIRERLAEQRENGSWEGRIVITARNLRELAELEVGKDVKEIQWAVDWLMRRPQSSMHPGMFFTSDELFKDYGELTRLGKKPLKGKKFSKKQYPEIKLAMTSENLIGKPPCGLRMMWPTALVLEALFSLGYEGNERVQTALRTLLSRRWCEASMLHTYQRGFCEQEEGKPYSLEEIKRIEQDYMGQYKYGGISSLEELSTKCLASRSGEKMPRITHKHVGEADEYLLRKPGHLQGCELRITRALSWSRNEKIRRLGEAYLWRFAGRQHSTDGRFVAKGSEKYLRIFAGYDCPVSKVVIMKSIPWIISDQNEDGSWGSGSTKDSSTLAIICALKRVELI